MCQDEGKHVSVTHFVRIYCTELYFSTTPQRTVSQSKFLIEKVFEHVLIALLIVGLPLLRHEEYHGLTISKFKMKWKVNLPSKYERRRQHSLLKMAFHGNILRFHKFLCRYFSIQRGSERVSVHTLFRRCPSPTDRA